VGLTSLSELRPGMVLASALFSRSGIMLLPRGTPLTAKHLDQFKGWGVHAALVEALGTDEPADAADVRLDPELLAAIDQALDDKFAVQNDDEIMAEVKRIVRKMAIEEALNRRRSGT
jgi:hypothetical protein